MQKTTAVPRTLPTAALVVASSHFLLEMGSNILPAIYPYLQTELNLSFEQIGRIALFGTIAGSLTQPLFGWLADRYSTRQMTLYSVIFLWILMSLVGVSPSYVLVIVCIVLARLGSAAFHPPAAALVRETNTRASGLAMSLFSVSGNWGAATAPVFIAVFLGYFGLRGTLTLLPLALLIGVLLIALFRLLPPEQPVVRPPKGERTTGSWLALLLIVVAVGSRSWVQGGLASYIPLWLIERGLTETAAAAQLSVVLFSMGIGSLIGGPLSDWVGRVTMMMVSLSLLIVAQWVFLNTGGTLQSIAGVLIGISVGISFPITLLLAQDAWPKAIGLASALIMGIGWVPYGVGAWVIGQVADANGLTFAMSTLTWVPVIGLIAIVAWQRFVQVDA